MSHVFKLQISPHVRDPNCSIKCLGLRKIARESGVGTAEGGVERGEGKSGLAFSGLEWGVVLVMGGVL